MKNFFLRQFGFMIIIILLSPITALSDSYLGKQIISADSLTISAVSDSQVVISVTGISQISAQCAINFHAPNLRNDTIIEVYMQNGIANTLSFTLPLRQGSWFVNITFSVTDSNVKSVYKDSLFNWESANTMFFRANNNSIEYQGVEPESNDIKMPVLSMGNSVPSLLGIKQKGEQTLTYTITVNITGRVLVGTTGNTRGVPVRVWLDWDYDNNINTGYTPYYWSNNNQNDRHIGWDDADMDGNFSFNFQFSSNIPANQISNSIRFYVSNGNSFVSTYAGQLLNTNVSFSIAQVTNNVSASGQVINVEMDRGFAIRFLTRARMFVAEKMGMSNISAVTYNIIDGTPHAWYSPSSTIITFRGGSSHNVSTAYHEYGHFVHHMTDEYMPTGGCGDSHWFTKETSFACAFTEGWAEFFSAACLEYWYVKEMSNQIASTSGTAVPRCNTHNWNVYQFLDYSQQLLCNQDRTKVEGAVASFFYSIYDGYGLRAPSYQGDNDDMSFDGGFLRGNLQAGRVYAYQCDCSYIEGFKNAFQASLSSYQ